ncbi:ABC transporter ATP-binding protein [Gloeobacter kilaueensis]|uniref:ABC transporter, ATP-binding protein n=1 Tax=Gloeobacter kilaueensis (strain ATCC BAA-2537 / CCAP 1431/1 / ULC 316 / JS1) TaxID=1183438 RepID=U5QM54_GLOK1|nr:ABC transporter ATP-binding protein [Gloeobacter kilaueensis]AGY59953.1 ABC transporter, ATP-binding protein [Gloeobacter kilaueensis JS1]
MLIRLENIRKSYKLGANEVDILKGIDLSIDQGEYVAIMGPSGSGKSTLMNIIGCLDRPTSGQYYLNGRNIATLDRRALAQVRNREIGFVFQQFNLMARSDALENVALPAIYAGISAKERKARASALLERVGLADRIYQRPGQLSGGQQQRVAIARALMNRPSILLADEPTGALDTRTGDEVLRLFEELNAEGLTLVVITHDQEVGDRAHRLIRLRDGQLETEASQVASR